MFNQGDLVKIKPIHGILRPFTGNDYRYKIIKIRKFLFFRSYDLICINQNHEITQKRVTEKELEPWWKYV